MHSESLNLPLKALILNPNSPTPPKLLYRTLIDPFEGTLMDPFTGTPNPKPENATPYYSAWQQLSLRGHGCQAEIAQLPCSQDQRVSEGFRVSGFRILS